MFASGRPLLHGSSSGGIACATPCASGPKRSFLAASSASAGPYSCPLRHATSSRLLDGGCWAPRSAAGANSSSAVESNASTLAGTALLTAQGLVSSYNGASRPTHIIDLPGSATATGHGQAELGALLSWEHSDPQQLAHALDGVRVAPSTAASSAPLAPPSDGVSSPSHIADPALPAHPQSHTQHAVSVAGAPGAAAVSTASRSAAPGAGSPRSDGAEASLATNGSGWAPPEDSLRPLPADSDAPQPEASTSAPASDGGRQRRRSAGTGRRTASASAAATAAVAASAAPASSSEAAATGLNGSAGSEGAAAATVTATRRGRGRPVSRSQDASQPAPAAAAEASAAAASPAPDSEAESAPQRTRQQQQQRRAPPPRPRLKPPPPPQSWPDYPYSRRSAASAITPGDEAAAKLEALFQCVLHAPRLPAKLLRFLRRAVPGGPAAALPLVTASVEGLSEVLGREMAMYLIRRRPWVVTVPAEAIVPRMEAVRRLLGLAPPGVLDLLRKNPNLLRMEPATLRGRYEALHRSTGFDAAQVRALVHKYPLILNFHPESVESAALALRRLCSARPSWAAHHQLLSPSQFAAFLRDRVQVLLRLEYLLLTGGGGGCTLRDIIKTSNNSFKRTHSGFRTWMFERLRRLRERLARARAAAAAEGRQLSADAAAELEEAATRQYEQEETARLVRELSQRRQEERAELIRREAQSRATIEERIRQEQMALAAAAGAEGAAGVPSALGGSDDEEDDEEDEAEAGQRRRGRAGDYWAGDGEDDAEWERQRQLRYQQQQAILRQRYQQQQRAGGGGAGAGAGGPFGARPRGDGSGDYLSSVTPGRFAWSRPGAKVPLDALQPRRQYPGGGRSSSSSGGGGGGGGAGARYPQQQQQQEQQQGPGGPQQRNQPR